MSHSDRIPASACCAALLLLATIPIASVQAADAAALPARWQQQEFTIDLVEFSTHYSCDGLRSELRRVLRELGAQPDIDIVTSGCMEPGFRGTRMPSVRLRFRNLQPGEDAGAQRGSWKSVNLVGPGKLDTTECEMIAEVVKQVLPHFTVRNVDPAPVCVPYSESLVTSLRLDVFVPAAG